MPDGSVVLVEIRGQRLTRVWPDGRKEVVAKIPGGPNGAAIGPDGKMLHLQQWRLWLDPNAGMMMPGAPARTNISADRSSASICNRQGRDPVRQMRRAPAEGAERSGVRPAGRPLVHRSRQAACPRHGCRRLLLHQARHEGDRRGRLGMLPANGIGLSPDEKTVYVAETPTARLVGLRPRRARRGQAARRDLSRRARQADRGAWRLSDVRFARGRGVRQYLRRDTGLGLHLGDRA